MFVLEEDSVMFIQKTADGYAVYNAATPQFTLLDDGCTQQTEPATRWTVFVYATTETMFSAGSSKKLPADGTDRKVASVPVECTLETVEGLLPSFKTSLDVGSIEMNVEDIRTLLNRDGDLNDK